MLEFGCAGCVVDPGDKCVWGDVPGALFILHKVEPRCYFIRETRRLPPWLAGARRCTSELNAGGLELARSILFKYFGAQEIIDGL